MLFITVVYDGMCELHVIINHCDVFWVGWPHLVTHLLYSSISKDVHCCLCSTLECLFQVLLIGILVQPTKSFKAVGLLPIALMACIDLKCISKAFPTAFLCAGNNSMKAPLSLLGQILFYAALTACCRDNLSSVQAVLVNLVNELQQGWN